MANATDNRPLNSKSKEIVYLVSEYFLKNIEDSRTPYLERTAEYRVDQTIRLHGHEVLRLPPNHPDFNAIELIWSQLKDYVRRMNTSFRYITCSRLMIIILLFMI